MNPEQKGQNQSGKSAVFLKRLASTITLWTVVLAALFAPWKVISLSAFFIIIVVLTVTGLLEFYGFIEKKNLPVYKICGILAGVVYTAVVFCLHAFLHQDFLKLQIISFAVFSLLTVLIFSRRLISPVNSDGFIAAGNTFEGFLYIPFLLGFVQFIYFSFGPYVLFFFMLITKFSDSGAYIFGSLFGKHKMAPSISPGKTWEGFAGAIIVPVAVGFLTRYIFPTQLAQFSALEIVALGVFLGISAVIGDLIESVFKRECGVKDSGNYFPGVGGILDVLDSILFNAPIMYFYLVIKNVF